MQYLLVSLCVLCVIVGCAEDGGVEPSAAAQPVSVAEPGKHEPTTRSAPMEHTNRLVHETSPYLLQHAHNPVDWYPWGDEAFEAARSARKLIFVSIGYSTCYWCHVMERESFEDEVTAAIMNERFISIKVDREERPDVDDIYMAATTISNQGSGGWPMSVFLEPDTLKPIFAGTYFPPEDSAGRLGFKSLLVQISEAWNKDPAGIRRQAEALATQVTHQLTQASWRRPLGFEDFDRGMSQLMGIYDINDGGFGGGRNKFPMPGYLELFVGAGWHSPKVQEAVTYTLERMARGGMYDQIGGGFHRYSTDRQWLVPHFEKMLYDNGQLASMYATVYDLTGDEFLAEVVRETLDYVLREMTDAAGGFYSAQDAEVNAREGDSYVWTVDEVTDVLRAAGLGDDVELAMTVYGLNKGTNFQDPHHPQDDPRNVLYLVEKPSRLAATMNYDPEDFNLRLAAINAALLVARDKREQPGLDDKIITGWNGLMIAGMADGGRVLQEQKYVDAARRAAEFILDTMDDGSGGLLRAYRQGNARISAVLEDYALMVRGLMALYRATQESRWLDAAQGLSDAAGQRFWDDRFGGYFDTLADQDDLFVRNKRTYDGAVPSGNGVMLNNLIDLYEATGDERFLDEAVATLQGISNSVAESPVGAVLSTLALSRLTKDYPERLAAAAPASRPDDGAVVVIETDTETVSVGKGTDATINVTLRIADGYHINANEPGLANLIPLVIQMTGGQGVVAVPAYPAGELFQGEIRVHHGTVRVPVTIRQVGPITGTPRLQVFYQVCTDRVCLMPSTTELDVQIVTIAGP